MSQFINPLVSQRQYSQISTPTIITTNNDPVPMEPDDEDPSLPKRARTSPLLILAAMGVWLSGIAIGIFLVRINHLETTLSPSQSEPEPTTLRQLLITTHTTQTVQHNPTFEAPPPPGGGNEPVWDALIPGTTYIYT
ncbi:hypothetical protein BO78DRAFT_420692 [Aspergillus sclerotiicarbonarius CBS 121057]|uniref:Uncharacterized protein n=1 Tax=Aspergillus sclerotiicarbonarius (strain CBS 121057 / IBT 28362) TaxID=1448318 RepID=A0A319E2Q3_ASPSB|nr:hypothetical protein BO78DRAFT_420692 [Aspergillus sclerotiicarbonarius CBS 121057]